jgi:hypothetical protein
MRVLIALFVRSSLLIDLITNIESPNTVMDLSHSHLAMSKPFHSEYSSSMLLETFP